MDFRGYNFKRGIGSVPVQVRNGWDDSGRRRLRHLRGSEYRKHVPLGVGCLGHNILGAVFEERECGDFRYHRYDMQMVNRAEIGIAGVCGGSGYGSRVPYRI